MGMIRMWTGRIWLPLVILGNNTKVWSLLYLKYVGEFAEGKMNGKGALKFKSGERYEGDFNEGMVHG